MASPRMFRIGNHDAALPIRRGSVGARRIPIRVDARHEMWWAGPRRKISASHFSGFGVREALLREVVPDDSRESAKNRRQISRDVRRIPGELPGLPGGLEACLDLIHADLPGKVLQIQCAYAWWQPR